MIMVLEVAGRTAPRIAGVLLVLAFVCFVIGAIVPLVGPRGNPSIFSLPVREQLLAVAGAEAGWRLANLLMGLAIVLLAGGMTIMTALLGRSGAVVLSRIGLAGLLIAAALWLGVTGYRSGVVRPGFETFADWSVWLIRGYLMLGCLSLAALSGALIMTSLTPAWVGWVALALSVAPLLQLMITGDTLPGFHYFPALLIGVVLLLR
ncbi:hypothetical protein [Microlunatus parietis]|uniref:DUF998 domain-containing protein n=1 Tax=Microlunatus parietis TaxID=682979 RepID=A0A7Y9IBA2_9ACTN|nr:hypothetical protein [Microlunatus parietis]NYE73540.1 hypothetical protein [Microlunatus parietis]